MSDQANTAINDRQYAGIWPRFLALFIDFIVFCIVFFPVTKLIKGVWLMSPGDHAWGYGWFITDPLCLSFLAIIFLYYVFLEGLFDATVGKMIIGIKVIQTDGNPCTMKQSLIRNVLRIVDSLPTLNMLGYIMVVTSPDKARLGDRIAGTRVVVGN